MSENTSDGWLSLDEAAARLGVSRLRLREAIAAGAISARRDNRGFWRVSLAGDDAAARRQIGAALVEPRQLVELLFDEIEEMSALLGDRDADVERMSRLVARQQDLLDHALRLAESPAAGTPAIDPERVERLHERSGALIEQTLSKLQARDAELSKMSGLVERALNTAAALDAEVTRQTEVTRKQQALLDRAFSLAQASLDRFSGGAGFFGRLRARIGGGRAGGR